MLCANITENNHSSNNSTDDNGTYSSSDNDDMHTEHSERCVVIWMNKNIAVFFSVFKCHSFNNYDDSENEESDC